MNLRLNLMLTVRQYGEPAPPQLGPSVKSRSRVLGTGWYFSQKAAKVQDLNCGQMRALTAVASAKAGVRVPRAAGSVIIAGVKAKTMTNKCPLLSVLSSRPLFYLTPIQCFYISNIIVLYLIYRFIGFYNITCAITYYNRVYAITNRICHGGIKHCLFIISSLNN